MTENNTAISINDLTKVFKAVFGGTVVTALDKVTFDVRRGEIFGLLGPNGAGKTTMIKVLLGSLRATGGGATIFGEDIISWRSHEKVGYLPENHRFPLYMTGMQTMKCFGGMAGLSAAQIKAKAGPLLELVGMTRWSDTKIRKYSKGMMQRIGLAQAMLNDPDLIFLDEPTDGVDPIGRREIRDILKDIKRQGRTIFLNSHLLAEVETTCDRVAILDKGKLLKVGPVVGLTEMKPSFKIDTVQLTDDARARISEKYNWAQIDGHTISIAFNDEKDVNGLIDLLRGCNVELLAVAPIRMGLEDSFMQLVKGAAQNTVQEGRSDA